AVGRAVANAGATEVAVAARRADRAGSCAKLAGGRGRVGTIDEADAVDIIVNATPIGMAEVVSLKGEPALPVDPNRLSPGQLVADLVYSPLVTPLVAAARDGGVGAVNGGSIPLHTAPLACHMM